MRRTDDRLINPRLGHERVAQRSYGVRSPKDIDDDARAAFGEWRAPAADRPRVAGSIHDGTLLVSLVETLRDAGIVDDEWVDIDAALPATFENNAGLRFRGKPPTIAIGAAGVVGAGATIGIGDATDNSGRITLVTGTGALAAGAIATVTFAVPKSNDDYGVLLTAADADAASVAGRSVYADFATRTTTAWVLSCATALATSTSYHWDFVIIEREQL